MVNRITIREYENSDETDVVTLWKDCNLTVPWNNPVKDIQRKESVQADLFLIADLDGRLVGTAMAGYDGHRGWINYLAVAPDCRRQGIGECLMQEAEARLVEMGCPKINVQIRSGNTEVLDFYRSIGFEEDEVVSLGKRLISDE